MKRILSILFLSLLVTSCGTLGKQPTADESEVFNFVISNNTVTWSNVFKASEIDQVKEWFNTEFSITRETNSGLVAETHQNALPVKEAGLSTYNVVMLLQHPCVVYFTADFKEDRYRIIVNKIIWSPQVGISTYGIHQGVGTIDLNELAYNDQTGGYKAVFYNKTAESLNTILNYLFTPKTSTHNDDNW